jgi:putative acetyltransferase
MIIRETTDADLNDILTIERAAFQRDSEVNLTQDLLSDLSAKPLLSLIATVEDQPVGHILFTRAYIINAPQIAVSFLAPLAVVPKFQRQGIGGALIKQGLALQTKSGIDLVFVIGHPTYYPKYGFMPASQLGFEATYPIPSEVADAWMVQALRPNIIGNARGKMMCCDAMNKPEMWRE